MSQLDCLILNKCTLSTRTHMRLSAMFGGRLLESGRLFELLIALIVIERESNMADVGIQTNLLEETEYTTPNTLIIRPNP